jgi:hypothetical protein
VGIDTSFGSQKLKFSELLCPLELTTVGCTTVGDPFDCTCCASTVRLCSRTNAI